MERLTDVHEGTLSFASLPTPLEECGRLPSGRCLLAKRDDLTGLGMGGNKVRKLVHLVTDARATGSDVLVTVGAAQSNHARATAAAAARTGLACHLVLGGPPTRRAEGNQLLASLFGAELHHAGTDSWDRLEREVGILADRLRAEGRSPYVIPLGGSTAVGATGFTEAWLEFVHQVECRTDEVGSVVVASSTGGTHAGMLAGRVIAGGPEIIAVDVAKERHDLAEFAVGLANEVLERLGRSERLDRTAASVDPRFVGDGYAVPTGAADEAMVRFARTTGLVLDRVYTAKAMACLVARDRDGSLPDGDVVFWHTGGQPALFSAAGAPALGARQLVPDPATTMEFA